MTQKISIPRREFLAGGVGAALAAMWPLVRSRHTLLTTSSAITTRAASLVPPPMMSVAQDTKAPVTSRVKLGITVGYPTTFAALPDRGASQFKTMIAAGVTSVRLGAYNFQTDQPSYFDATIKAARSAGLDVLLMLGDLRDAPSIPEFVAWCGATAAYYAPHGIHHYEVLNEVNIATNWGPGHQAVVNPAAYAALLGQCYRAIKEADPTATVLHAGLAPAQPNGGSRSGGNYEGTLSAVAFLSEMYRAMGGRSDGYFDVGSQHAYTYGDASPVGYPSARHGAFYAAVGPGTATDPTCRYVMSTNGDSAKPIYITEIGLPTGTTGGYQAYTKIEEAETFTTAFSVLQENGWDWVHRLYAYKWNDDDTDDFGLLTTTFGPKKIPAASYSGQPAAATTVLEVFSAGSPG